MCQIFRLAERITPFFAFWEIFSIYLNEYSLKNYLLIFDFCRVNIELSKKIS